MRLWTLCPSIIPPPIHSGPGITLCHLDHQTVKVPPLASFGLPALPPNSDLGAGEVDWASASSAMDIGYTTKCPSDSQTCLFSSRHTHNTHTILTDTHTVHMIHIDTHDTGDTQIHTYTHDTHTIHTRYTHDIHTIQDIHRYIQIHMIRTSYTQILKRCTRYTQQYTQIHTGLEVWCSCCKSKLMLALVHFTKTFEERRAIVEEHSSIGSSRCVVLCALGCQTGSMVIW